MVIVPVSLTFFSVPVSSSALDCPARQAATSARPILRRHLIRALPLDHGRNACINRAERHSVATRDPALLQPVLMRYPCNGWAIAWAGPASHRLVGSGIGRIRRICKFVLELGGNRRVEVQPL